MRIIELEIYNTRGIPDLVVKPNGKNFVIYGPNGSGKSAVVDAIDFLLTGRISRLTGAGTGEITLSKHGPHIDHKPKEAKVLAKVKLPRLRDPIEIERCMAHPNVLVCDESVVDKIEPVKTLAWRGQHVLSRREILKYITAERRTRAQEIQELLNIGEIEEIRKSLVRAQSIFSKEMKAIEGTVETAMEAINATIQEKIFNEKSVLRIANENRAVLGGAPILAISSRELKKGVRRPAAVTKTEGVSVTLLERGIQNLCNVGLEENQTIIGEADKKLRTLIGKIRSDPDLLRALSRLELTKLGMELIDDTGSCPLCDKPWPPGELRKYLEERLSTAEVAAKQQQEIEDLSSIITSSVNRTKESLKQVLNITRAAGLKDFVLLLESWLSGLEEIQVVLDVAVERYPDGRFDPDSVKQMLCPAEGPRTLKRIESVVKDKYPEATPEEIAWDVLTALEENLKGLEKAETSLEKAKLCQKKASNLLDFFQSSRDEVLGKLYDEISDRFVDLYRQLHGLDESDFAAKIRPEEAGLDFEVDFYGRGTHPPHALHSEGHQDSMGVCLYLALAERLTKGVIDLVILDDVVMSVDADHRRQVCRLLGTSFPHRQFLITTHDKTWSNQLKSESIVSSKETIEFYNWNINTGPQVNYGVDMWKRIEDDIRKNDIPSAAGKLRRGSEDFFEQVCDNLQAQVKYKLIRRWELGDYLPAAVGQFRNLIRAAKESAESWGDKEKIEMLGEVYSTIGQVYERSNAERWAVNASVHYNNWANLRPNDFRPVVEAFQDLHSQFICTKCGGMLYVATKGLKPVGIECHCGKVNWKLIKMKDTKT